METPEFYQTTYYNSQFTTADNNPKNGVDAFIIEDLLDFPIDDGMVDAGDDCAALTGGTSTVSSPAATAPTADNSCNSSFSTAEPPEPYLQTTTAHGFADDHFSNELCVPYDDLAELEWLSNFVDESFSSEDLQKMQLIQGMKAARTTNDSSENHQYQFQPPEAAPLIPIEMSVPAKARSKRPRAAPGNWTSRLLAVSTSPPAAFISAPAMSSSSESDVAAGAVKKSGKPAAAAQQKKKESSDSSGSGGGGEGRRCVHCATDKTPQWRTGPMGPKTLCNACGVRYKSGRLVPEYRPASSPTFVMTKHSNSHRKVMELRRQKEMVRAQQNQQQQFMHHHQNMMFDVSNGDDYLIHQHIGPDYRQII